MCSVPKLALEKTKTYEERQAQRQQQQQQQMKQSTAKMAASASNSGHAGESGLMEEANGGSGAAAAMDPLSTFLVRPFRH